MKEKKFQDKAKQKRNIMKSLTFTVDLNLEK